MSLIHEFILVSKGKHAVFDYSTIKRDDLGKILIESSNIVDVVEINDALMLYLMDYFNWIPSHWNINMEQASGLNYHGITFILNENKLMFGKVFSLLADLFSVAPSTFKLKGDFYYGEDDKEVGAYDFITYNREEVVCILKKMVTWSEFMNDNANLYIVHMGV